MKKWKLQFLLTVILFVGVAIFALSMQKHIVATSLGQTNIDARDELMGRSCGTFIVSGVGLIWILPFLMKLKTPKKSN